jgi:hypothetical protein
VEGHSRYADEPEPSWYSGGSLYDSGLHERGAFRLPDQRSAEAGDGQPPYAPDAGVSTGSIGLPNPDPDDPLRMPVRGPEYPTIRPNGGTSPADPPPYGTAPAHSAGMPATAPTDLDATGLVPSFTDEVHPAGEAVYRSRRPFSALLIAIVTVLLLVPVVMLLIQVTFGEDPTVRGVVPAVLLAVGLPLTGVGLYALAAGGPAGRDAWLRPPLAYLPVGVLLLLAAGLSVA